MARNPFAPTFGASPHILIGRDQILDDVRDSFDDGPQSPTRTVLFVGARGTGKTVMLNAYEDHAAALGWLIVRETASRGLLDRLTRDHLPRLLAEHGTRSKERLTQVSLTTPFGGGGGTVVDRFPAESTLRAQVVELTNALRPRETGLVITVDEVQSADRDELRKLGELMQVARREQRDLAFAAAGLPWAVADLLNDDVVTFLRRAERYDLGDVPVDEVADAYVQTFSEAGRELSDDDALYAAEATYGYPFLVQLVGHRIWLQHPLEPTVTRDDVRIGVTQATKRLGLLVHEPAVARLSDMDKAYVEAMAIDGEGPSRTGEIATRLGVSAQYAGVYRDRLISNGTIEPAGHGLVRFAIPYLGVYLQERTRG
ncbi:ATP-binding protein [Austwickia sp. TVS 96-490-7B]|uniref:ATP-binding protein n=1 Tax=Austwickia sp. TVS 96-490-7B TaxID=2830843 RepID=UPI001C57A27E|nr:ATP-binding protein [Austwickia sp. TVS 96-490-7B]